MPDQNSKPIFMTAEKNKIIKALTIRITENDYEDLLQQFKKTTCTRFSFYARKRLLREPIVAYYRNQSLDDFMTAMLPLVTTLSTISNNYTLLVNKLHQLQDSVPPSEWYKELESERKNFVAQIEKINQKLGEISDLWLQ